MKATPAARLGHELEALGASLEEALEAFPATITLLGADGTVLWQNAVSLARAGDRRGASFLHAIAPEHRHAVETEFLRLRFDPERWSRREVVVVDEQGRRKRSIALSAPVRGPRGQTVAVLAIAFPVNWDDGPTAAPHLAPRQLDTLELLGAGLSTSEIASQLGVTRETARNYIRRLLKALDVHSRVEAVARGRALRLLADPDRSSGG